MWPEYSQLNVYRCPLDSMYSTTDRCFDLSDHITNNVTFDEINEVFIGLKTISPDWGVWNKKSLKKIEKLIEYDLNFDGFKVEIDRWSSETNILSDKEFIWKLNISIGTEVDEVEEIRTRTSKFPNFVIPKNIAVPSIEIDVDYLPEQIEYKSGDWEDKIRAISAQWVNENNYLITHKIQQL